MDLPYLRGVKASIPFDVFFKINTLFCCFLLYNSTNWYYIKITEPMQARQKNGDKTMTINKSNYYIHTSAIFTICATPRRKPDHISASGSKYWYVNDGVIRNSDHWGEVAYCDWYIAKNDRISEQAGLPGKRVSAFCSFDQFHQYSDCLVAIGFDRTELKRNALISAEKKQMKLLRKYS